MACSTLAVRHSVKNAIFRTTPNMQKKHSRSPASPTSLKKLKKLESGTSLSGGAATCVVKADVWLLSLTVIVINGKGSDLMNAQFNVLTLNKQVTLFSGLHRNASSPVTLKV